jgi:hypothetical protein
MRSCGRLSMAEEPVHRQPTGLARNLAGLTGMTMMRDRGGFVTTLTLHWPHHTRRLEPVRSSRSGALGAPHIMLTGARLHVCVGLRSHILRRGRLEGESRQRLIRNRTSF